MEKGSELAHFFAGTRVEIIEMTSRLTATRKTNFSQSSKMIVLTQTAAIVVLLVGISRIGIGWFT